MPDALITVLEIEENLVRKELSAAEREAQTIRLAAALKKLNGGKPVALASASGEAAETGNLVPGLASANGGRGNKGVAQKVAGKAGITKRAVNKRLAAASAAIGEKVDLDLDTPEELERKADKRQQAQPKPKVERRKRTKSAPCVATADPTQPAVPPAAEIDRLMEGFWKAFNAIGREHQLLLIHDACLRLGLDPLRMAPPAVFGLAEEDPEPAVDLPAEVPPATDDAAVAVPAEQRDDVADVGTDDLQDAADDMPEAARQVPGDPTKCAYCHARFSDGDPSVRLNGRFYHRKLWLEHVKPIAIAPSRRCGAPRYPPGADPRSSVSAGRRGSGHDLLTLRYALELLEPDGEPVPVRVVLAARSATRQWLRAARGLLRARSGAHHPGPFRWLTKSLPGESWAGVAV
jgi:hypothetical protein